MGGSDIAKVGCLRDMKYFLVVLAVLILTLSCTNSTQVETEQIPAQDTAAFHNQRPLDIPIGVGLLTNYGYDVDQPEEGWPSMWGIGGWGWNSVVGLPGALWRSFVSNEPAPDFRDAGQTGFYPSDDPQVVDWQARKIMEAGFDFLVLDWQGWGDPDLDGVPGPAYIDQRTNDAVKEWMRWFDANPEAPLQFAIFVHIFPIGAGGLDGPLTNDQKGMILDYAWDQFYGQRTDRVFRWEGLPLLVTGFEMGFADADDERFRVRNWYAGDAPGPDDWQEGTRRLNADGMAMVKPRWDEWWHYLAQHRTNWNDWNRPHGGFREDPYLKERLYDDQWRWLTQERDARKLQGVWVIAWNEYATQNYLEPDMGLGPDAVGENMVWKTAHYIKRLQAGEDFGYYEPLWVDPQHVLGLAGSPTPEEFGFSTDPNALYTPPVQLMIAEARLNALALEVSKAAQGMVAEYLGCEYANGLFRVATLAADTEAKSITLYVELARPFEEATIIQVGMGPTRELVQVAEVTGENPTVLTLALPLQQAHKALEPVLMADSPKTRTSFPKPSGTVRQATAEVAANILANVIVRQESLGETLKLDWVFDKEVREALDSFKC